MAFRRKIFKQNDPLRSITATHMQDITDVLHFLDVFNGHIDKQGNYWTIVLDQLDPEFKGFDADTGSSPDTADIANRRSIETDTDGWVSQYGWSNPTEDSTLSDSLHLIELRRLVSNEPEQRYITPSNFATAIDTHLTPILDSYYLRKDGDYTTNTVASLGTTGGDSALFLDGKRLAGGPWNIEGGIQADGDTGFTDSDMQVILSKKNTSGYVWGYFRSGLFVYVGDE